MAETRDDTQVLNGSQTQDDINKESSPNGKRTSSQGTPTGKSRWRFFAGARSNEKATQPEDSGTSRQEETLQIPLRHEVVQEYFRFNLYNEYYPICMVGCGEAGREMVGYLRLKPEFVAAYLPEYYPVRAAAFDTQISIFKSLDENFHWPDRNLQHHIPGPVESRVREILERETNRAANKPNRPLDTNAYIRQYSTGGAGGKAILGRAAALLSFKEEKLPLAQTIHTALNLGRLFQRANGGYLLSFSSLGGGTGSGATSVIVDFVAQNLAPGPIATFSICVAPDTRDRRSMSNQLTSLYYSVKTEAIDGIILTCNSQIEESEIKPSRLNPTEEPDYQDVDQRLQDILMPIFLAAQTTQKFILEMDPRNVKACLQIRVKRPELIAACFAIYPLPNASARIRNMKRYHVSNAKGKRWPDLDAMLTVALENPSIKCDLRANGRDLNTARRAIALIAGPPQALADMGLTHRRLEDFERLLAERVLDPNFERRDARAFTAKFPNMTDVRMTVLVCDPGFPDLENCLGQAWNGKSTWERRKGESLADSLRRLPEPEIRGLALSELEGD